MGFDNGIDVYWFGYKVLTLSNRGRFLSLIGDNYNGRGLLYIINLD